MNELFDSGCRAAKKICLYFLKWFTVLGLLLLIFAILSDDSARDAFKDGLRKIGIGPAYASFIGYGELRGSDILKLKDFINNHGNEIVYISAYVDSETLDTAYSKDFSIYTLSVPSVPQDECESVSCGGEEFNFKMKERKAIYWSQGGYMIDGFFLVRDIVGMHQGWVSTDLEEQDRAEIILKMGSPPKS